MNLIPINDWRSHLKFERHYWQDMLIRSKSGAVVRAQASHQCGPGSNPCINAICGLSLLLVLSVLRFQFTFPRKPPPKSNLIWNAGHDYIRTLKCFLSERVSTNNLFCLRLIRGCLVYVTSRHCEHVRDTVQLEVVVVSGMYTLQPR